VSEPADSIRFRTVLGDLVNWLQEHHTPGIVIGGIAAGILGRPRTTADVDVSVIVDEPGWSQFAIAGEKHGFVLRQPDAVEFAQRSRVLLVRHKPTGISVDIAFAALPFELQAIARAQTGDFQGLSFPLPTPEDLIIMKAVAHRQRDLGDIESIVDSHPHLDRRRIIRWVRDFAAILEMPEIVSDLQTILKRPGPKV
jgi:hypothetical protein